MRKVEAEPIRRDQRAFLLHMIAQLVTQGGVQQVGGGVVARDVVAALAFNSGYCAVTDGWIAFHHFAYMYRSDQSPVVSSLRLR